MPLKFLDASFEFNPGTELPEHESGVIKPTDEIDPTLWRIEGFDTYDRVPYHIAINIEELAFAGILAEAWERKNGEQGDRLARDGLRDRAKIVEPTEGENVPKRDARLAWD